MRNAKLLILTLTAVMLIVITLSQTASAAPPQIKNPYQIITATIEDGSPSTVDPAACYDTASGAILFQCYDTLVSFDAEHMETVRPDLATSWTIENLPAGTTSPEGLTWSQRYTFALKSGVKFHDGSILTPRDVEFSIEREMAMDIAAGPQWMFFQPLLNGASTTSINGNHYNMSLTADQITVGKMIDHAVESNATHVWFNVAFPGGYEPFIQILTQSWADVISQNWVKNTVIGELGRPAWNGEWGDYTSWVTFRRPQLSPLDDPTPIEMGSGPFYLESLDYTAKQWSVLRFVDYHQGWPASWPKLGAAQPAGYVNRFVETWAFTWETRSTSFLAGDVDFCAVPRQYKAVVLNQPGIRNVYPLPTLTLDAIHFTYDIVPTTPYGPILPAGTFDQNGIPSDFFGNATWGIHVRKAFAYAFDYETYLATAWLGEATHIYSAIIPGLLGYNASIKGYDYNLTAAAAELHQVPGLWDTGFTITVLYNTDNIPRQESCELLRSALEGMNPKFHVNIVSVEWRTYLYAALVYGQCPIWDIGWLVDYPDPHDFAYPYYFSEGDFAGAQGYSNPAMDTLIDSALMETDAAKRIALYSQISELAIADCPSFTLQQGLGRHFERDWICGWYYNMAYPDNYIYNLWKWYYQPQSGFDSTTAPISNDLPVDVDYNGKVNILDITIVAQAFGASYGPPIGARWQFRADIDNNRVVNIIDIAAVARYFNKVSTTWIAPSA
jgi:peptide/nickel transport system substrate-binding protein